MRSFRTVLMFLAAGTVSAVACRGNRPAAWSRAVEAAEAPLQAALRNFDAAAREREPARMKEAAAVALAEARKARDALESSHVPPETAYARSEELIFLNHLVPGFQAFLASAGRPADLARLVSIRERAERHRRRGREAMSAAG